MHRCTRVSAANVFGCECVYELLRIAFANKDLETVHRQVWLLHQRSSLIIAFGTKSAVFDSNHKLRLQTVCCERFAWLQVTGNEVTDGILKMQSATDLPHCCFLCFSGALRCPSSAFEHIIECLRQAVKFGLAFGAAAASGSKKPFTRWLIRLHSSPTSHTHHGKDKWGCPYNAKKTSTEHVPVRGCRGTTRLPLSRVSAVPSTRSPTHPNKIKGTCRTRSRHCCL